MTDFFDPEHQENLRLQRLEERTHPAELVAVNILKQFDKWDCVLLWEKFCALQFGSGYCKEDFLHWKAPIWTAKVRSFFEDHFPDYGTLTARSPYPGYTNSPTCNCSWRNDRKEKHSENCNL